MQSGLKFLFLRARECKLIDFSPFYICSWINTNILRENIFDLFSTAGQEEWSTQDWLRFMARFKSPVWTKWHSILLVGKDKTPTGFLNLLSIRDQFVMHRLLSSVKIVIQSRNKDQVILLDFTSILGDSCKTTAN